MTKPAPKNLPASVRQKLTNLARERNVDFGLILVKYGLERILFRLSRSRHRDVFILKGALLFELWTEQRYRPTRDADFLARGDNAPERFAHIFRELCVLEVAENGLRFDADTVEAERISEDADYEGVRVTFVAYATYSTGQVTKTLTVLKESPATAKAKAKFILATDGVDFEAENLASGETVACAYKDFPDHFGFFLPLAGITTVRQIAENSFDIRATSRLNRLYVELLKDNPAWGTAERRHDMNHFMARLIFCFFAEDTDIFKGTRLFTDTIAQMSAKDSSNTHEVIGELFRAMNTKNEDRESATIPRWADTLPYVNGGLFSDNMDVPRFSRIARSYLLHIGNLDWT